MSKRLRTTIALGLSVGVYFFLKLFPFGSLVLYPFQLLVTFLHEFGHALGSLITGGGVHEIQINSDGSGVTTTSGGWRAITIAGGYIGSAVFGNLIMRAGLRFGTWSKYVLDALLVILVAIATLWSGSLSNTIISCLFAIAIYWVSTKSDEFIAWFLTFIGTVSVLYVIADFRVGPSSDLAQFTREVPVLSQTLWMFTWLAFVVAITWRNVRSLLHE